LRFQFGAGGFGCSVWGLGFSIVLFRFGVSVVCLSPKLSRKLKTKP